ncbi:unnamed protein product [Prunus armeniaca]
MQSIELELEPAQFSNLNLCPSALGQLNWSDVCADLQGNFTLVTTPGAGESARSKHSESSNNIDADGDEDWSWISQLLSRLQSLFKQKFLSVEI